MTRLSKLLTMLLLTGASWCIVATPVAMYHLLHGAVPEHKLMLMAFLAVLILSALFSVLLLKTVNKLKPAPDLSNSSASPEKMEVLTARPLIPWNGQSLNSTPAWTPERYAKYTDDSPSTTTKQSTLNGGGSINSLTTGGSVSTPRLLRALWPCLNGQSDEALIQLSNLLAAKLVLQHNGASYWISSTDAMQPSLRTSERAPSMNSSQPTTWTQDYVSCSKYDLMRLRRLVRSIARDCNSSDPETGYAMRINIAALDGLAEILTKDFNPAT